MYFGRLFMEPTCAVYYIAFVEVWHVISGIFHSSSLKKHVFLNFTFPLSTLFWFPNAEVLQNKLFAAIQNLITQYIHKFYKFCRISQSNLFQNFKDIFVIKFFLFLNQHFLRLLKNIQQFNFLISIYKMSFITVWKLFK